MNESKKESDRSGLKTEVEVLNDAGFARTLIQFFIIPAVVVAISVGLFFFFAWLISDEKTGVDYLREIRNGSSNRRWQAAFELSKLITMGKESELLKGLAPEMAGLFESSVEDDPRIRHYLALTLGHLADPSVTPVLVEALDDADATTRLYSVWALGNIGDVRAVTPMLPLVRDADPGVRKMSVYSLGALGDPRAIPTLLSALEDPQADVGMNAAVSLAQLGDHTGGPRLVLMLDRDYMNSLGEMNEEQRVQAIESAIKAATMVGGAEILLALRELADEDSSLYLRQAALEALAELDARGEAEALH